MSPVAAPALLDLDIRDHLARVEMAEIEMRAAAVVAIGAGAEAETAESAALHPATVLYEGVRR